MNESSEQDTRLEHVAGGSRDNSGEGLRSGVLQNGPHEEIIVDDDPLAGYKRKRSRDFQREGKLKRVLGIEEKNCNKKVRIYSGVVFAANCLICVLVLVGLFSG